VPRSRALLLGVAIVLPPALLAALGPLHPIFLTPETAERWRLVHLLLLPVFPLVGASVWLLLLGERGVLAWVARGFAFAYAVLYTALDSIAGIGAPSQVLATSDRGDARPPIEDLFAIGDPLGHLGVAALAVAIAVAAAVLFARFRSLWAVLGGIVAVASCWLFYRHHVFPPRGVFGVAGIAVGFALLALARTRRAMPARSN
jgi:hypothetical protein